jgi:DinB superfamily
MSVSPIIMQSLAAMPQQLEQVYSLVPAQARRWRPHSWEGIPGEMFCADDQACHVRDIEVQGYQVRIRRMLGEDRPDLVSFDSYALARDRTYDQLDATAAVADFRRARAETVAILQTLTSAQLMRRATFGEYGEVTLAGLVHFLCSHDQQHLACMQWLLGKIDSQ